ncbi:FixH family protein [Pedobacter sp. AW1-32]|uniref:FixH family protein n=1 Tax=Pedobacter sp. AW1-32 TaxID=3383026 RepID=UPI003FEE1772
MNWGTKIVMGMAAFMLFIIGMVMYMFSVHNRDALIEDNYYEKGINFNSEYTAAQNMLNDQASPEIIIDQQKMVILLRDSAEFVLTLMRPSNKKQDRKIEGHTIGATNAIVLNKKDFAPGMWFLSLSWTHANKPYLFKKNITF